MESPASPAACQRCRKDLRGRRAFAFRGQAVAPGRPPLETIKCGFCALLHRPMLKRSAIAALVVGTILTLLNQGDGLMLGQWDNALYWKIPLTYCVPFLVATYGALINGRR